jgi:WD40 repeat protein
MVSGAEDFKRFQMKDLKFISGHTGAIHDIQFSPFHDNILASASNDCSVKIWMIPEEGIQEETTKCDANLAAHAKRVSLIQFHPTSEFTLASASNDYSVKIWDVQNEKPLMSYDNLVKDPFCLEWNYDGSRLAVITKEKKMHIFDPRSPDEAQTTMTHENNKS